MESSSSSKDTTPETTSVQTTETPPSTSDQQKNSVTDLLHLLDTLQQEDTSYIPPTTDYYPRFNPLVRSYHPMMIRPLMHPYIGTTMFAPHFPTSLPPQIAPLPAPVYPQTNFSNVLHTYNFLPTAPQITTLNHTSTNYQSQLYRVMPTANAYPINQQLPSDLMSSTTTTTTTTTTSQETTTETLSASVKSESSQKIPTTSPNSSDTSSGGSSGAQSPNEMKELEGDLVKFKNRKRRRKQSKKYTLEESDKKCSWCHTNSTTQWRKGNQNETLCNACGLQFKKWNRAKGKDSLKRSDANPL